MRGPLSIHVVTPAATGTTSGNQVTAERWAGLLRELGHGVRISEGLDGAPRDLVIFLHARKSSAAIEQHHLERPEAPLVVALTGTDVYEDLDDPAVQRTLRLATRLVALQSLVAPRLPAAVRGKVRVIHQSVTLPERDGTLVQGLDALPRGSWPAAVLAHLRDVKDPLLAARAARLLPPESRVLILHAGAALQAGVDELARTEQDQNPRYRWLGGLSRSEAFALLARCRVLVLSSRSEGGANVIGEAVACGLPVISSRIDGSVGLLGEDYPGYFPVGDEEALAALMHRAETEVGFLAELSRRLLALKALFEPERERLAWQELLGEI